MITDTLKSAIADAKNEYAQISVNKCAPCLVFTQEAHANTVLEAATSAINLQERVKEMEGVIEGAEKALQRFSTALEKAEATINENVEYRASHVVRTTTYWLSYNDFTRANETLSNLAAVRKK